MSQAYVVFDRDGTLIDHIHHLKDPRLVKLKPGLVQALKMLALSGFKFGIVTNQSVVARGIASNEEVQAINSKIVEFVGREGIIIDFILICPHLPSAKCDCRKPKIGLGLQAVRENRLSPTASFMIGDQESDLIFGKNLGCRVIQLKGNALKSHFADYYSDSLIDAANWIIGEKG